MSIRRDHEVIHNFIDGAERAAASGKTFEKLNPATGELMSLVARSDAADVDAAIGCRRRGPAGMGTRDPCRRAG